MLRKPIVHLSDEMKELFWTYVNKTDNENDCWYWKLSHNNHCGYGKFSIPKVKKSYSPSRYAYAATYGDPDLNLIVLHSCDNRACCNPKHLSLGTSQDNSTDMKNKNRAAKGLTHGMSKLKESDIVKLKQMWQAADMRQVDIAKHFNIHIATARRAATGESWKHVQ